MVGGRVRDVMMERGVVAMVNLVPMVPMVPMVAVMAVVAVVAKVTNCPRGQKGKLLGGEISYMLFGN